MDEKNNVAKTHKVLLSNRKSGAFSGVVDVLKQWSIQVEVTDVDELLIKAYDGTIEYHYAETKTADNITEEETEAG